MAIHEIRVTPIDGDPLGHEVQQEAERTLDLQAIDAVRTAKVYRVQGVSEDEAHTLATHLFTDPVSEQYSLDQPIGFDTPHVVEVAYKPGVMNPEASSIMKAAQDLGINPHAADSSREYLAVGQSACKFVRPEDFAEQPIPMQTAHGEGRFFGNEDDIRQLKENGQIVFRYSNTDLSPPNGYPKNPNGAIDDIAGICDPSGLVLGMMPHPERSVVAFHPYRVRTEAARNAANTIFNNIVTYAKEM
jgi:phosphoribosylformylglycinamidine (FGAM) synthase PurS component